MTHQQVCFTRISGQGSNDGWQAVNASPDLSREAIASFTRFQNGNITPPVFDEEDAGNQIVAELQNDGTNAFYTLIKCNAAADDRGRSIMFAHSFVFPLDVLIKTPQEVLGVERSNFRFDLSATASAPAALAKSAPVSLKDAVLSLGLTEKTYTVLVQCVHFILDAKTKNSLHIICDCEPDTILRLMTCIYAALPFEFRKKITFSTYEFQNGAVKTIIFDRRVKNSGAYYLVPGTGENNLLTDVVQKRMAKYDFMRIVPDRYSAPLRFDGYFEKMEEQLALFGSAQTTSLDLYKIAYDLLIEEKDMAPDALCRRLNELLSAPISHPYLDQRIQLVLSDIVERKVILNDVLSEKLSKKLESTQDQDLIECGHAYAHAKVSQMSVEAGAKYLYDVYQNRQSESFLQLRGRLDKDEKGQAILGGLYANWVAPNLPVDRVHILDFYEETLGLTDGSLPRRALLKMISEYARELVRQKDPVALVRNLESLFAQVNVNPRDGQAYLLGLTKQFWQIFRYEDLNLSTLDIYEFVKLPEEKKYQMVVELRQICAMFLANDVPQFKREVATIFSNGPLAGTAEENRVIAQKLLNYFLQNQMMIPPTELDIWIVIAGVVHQAVNKEENPMKFLIENQIRPLCQCFEEAYPNSDLPGRDSLREIVVGWLTDCTKEKTECAKIASDALRVIRDEEKRARHEKKKQEKEERREAKESREETREPAAKPSRFGLFKKKNDNESDGGSRG